MSKLSTTSVFPKAYTSARIQVCAVAQLCPALCGPMDCSLPGSSVHGTLQTRVLEWAAISSSRGSSRPRNETHVFCTAGGCFTTESSGKPHTHRPQSALLATAGLEAFLSVQRALNSHSDHSWGQGSQKTCLAYNHIINHIHSRLQKPKGRPLKVLALN